MIEEGGDNKKSVVSDKLVDLVGRRKIEQKHDGKVLLFHLTLYMFLEDMALATFLFYNKLIKEYP